MDIFGTLKGIATELFDLPAKGERVTPTLTGTRYDMTANISGRRANRECYHVLEVTAGNYWEAAQFAEGRTIEGDVSTAIVRVGHNRWEIRVEEWDTDFRE